MIPQVQSPVRRAGRSRLLMRSIFALLAMVSLATTFAFFAGRSELVAERASKMPGRLRTPEEQRGLLNSLLTLRNEHVPSFIPESMWGRSVCAATIVGAVNFIRGYDQLKVADAWTFARDNAGELDLVWERERDFKMLTEEEKIKETKDSVFRITKMLETVGTGASIAPKKLYVLGYRYHETHADPAVIRERSGYNTHLVLVVGRALTMTDKPRYAWYGYHMFHDPKDAGAHPFRVMALDGSMPADFDLVYIWSVKGSEMPLEGKSLAFVNTTRPYRSFGWLMERIGSGRIGYALGTALAYAWGEHEQFPRVADLSRPIVELQPADSRKGWRGQLLGFYNGVPVFRQGAGDSRSPWGVQYQCVEFVNRYYSRRLGHKNMQVHGHADSYFHDPGPKRLIAFANGNSMPPQVDDILVFDQDRKIRGALGHVAIVSSVTESQVCIVQQSGIPWHTCLPLAFRDGGWHVGNVRPDLPCVGWSRKGR